jgi:C_GCAxxG_C_C family probable redox protein
MSLKERATENFKKGLNCSQSVFEAYSGISGLDCEGAKAVSAGFGGGMGRAQKTCGAVTGAIMAISCKYHDNKDLPASKEKTYAKTREFLKRFEKINDSTECYDLLGVDLKTEEGKEKYKTGNMFEERCLKYVQDACDILEDMI